MSDTPFLEWAVVILKKVNPHGKKVWEIVLETNGLKEAVSDREWRSAEGFQAHIVRFVSEVER